QFKLDGNDLGPEDTQPPFSITWDTTGLTDGEYTLTAVARDAAGHTTTSDGVDVTVDNSSPTEYTAYKASTAPTIDGDLSEYVDAEAIQLSNAGGTSGTYKLLYDNTNLYIAVEVDDENVN